jgi:membrane associated rhomboid family serine protease
MRIPFLTSLIVGAMVAMFATGTDLPLDGASSGWDRLLASLTSVVTHSSWSHLINNAIMVSVFGPVVEVIYGRRWIVALVTANLAVTELIIAPHQVVRGASVFACALIAFVLVAAVRHIADTIDLEDTMTTWVACQAAFVAAATAVWQIGTDVVGLSREIPPGATSVVGHAFHLGGFAAGALVALVAAVSALPRLVRTLRRKRHLVSIWS